ncbi:MAG: ribonuclease PH [Halobacteriovoraceae bacterium]|nr:ribonuclease PH [Halobacteriovoraceae bacterium]
MANILRDTPREINIQTKINPYAAGSVIVSFGNTKVHVTATVEESVPPWMRDSKKGWVTAEYAMLPSSTHTRSRRERKGISGRSQEIQRLIGRSLRAAIDLEKLGERTITIDCDVLVADGGTRTTSISGAYVALALAIRKLQSEGKISKSPLTHQIAAISVGVTRDGAIISDLNYDEDSSCETDMNIVMTKSGEFVEVQGTAEGKPFSREEFNALIECAEKSLKIIFEKQDAALRGN